MHTTVQRLGLLLALLAPPISAAPEATNPASIVDETIRPLMAQHDIPGMAVAVAVDGRSFVFNYGVSSRQGGVAVDDSTLFEIGSISKMFTATLAAYGHVTGKLSLDDHPGRYVARLRGRPIDRATLLHLGTYTAGGLPLQFPDSVRTDASALDYFRKWKAEAAPGAVREYSNPSIGLLGAVTSVAMKDSFDRLLETHLLHPLGMNESYVRVPPQAMIHYAWGHREGRAVRVNPGPLADETYGIKSTASDLLRFVRANIDGGGLDAALRDAIRVTQVARFSAGSMTQGFGWEQFPYPLSREMLVSGNSPGIIFERTPVHPVSSPGGTAARLFDKTGSTGGFGAYVVFVPERRFGLVMLANRNFPIAARVEAAYAIMSRLLPTGR